MNFMQPGWAVKKFQGILSALNPVPIAALPDIHDGGGIQIIQGGTIDEHFHITSAEYTFLQFIKAQPLYVGPVMDDTAELIIDSEGNCVLTGEENYVA